MLEPLDQVGALRAAAAGGVERCPVRVLGHPVEVGAEVEQPLGRPSLATGAGVPEGLGDVLRRGDGLVRQQLVQYVEETEGGRFPEPVDGGTASDEQSGHVPAAVTDRVGERRADRAVGHVDVRPGVDEDGGHVGVVAARRPVQRRLAMLVVAAIVDIGTCVDEQLGRLGPVGEEAGPVGDDVQRRPASGGTPKTRGRQTRLGLDELSQCLPRSPLWTAAITAVATSAAVIVGDLVASVVSYGQLDAATRLVVAYPETHPALDEAPAVGGPHFHGRTVRAPVDATRRARRAELFLLGSCPGGAFGVASPNGKATVPDVCTNNRAHTRIGTSAPLSPLRPG